ncbi:hypothetical protein Bbelb_388520 [Branchiostoma belcheri]|nr:hypothetical protein Bbelb_388520 [Branchiostoma belcheri]
MSVARAGSTKTATDAEQSREAAAGSPAQNAVRRLKYGIDWAGRTPHQLQLLKTDCDEHFVFVVEEPVVVSVINYAINSTVERFPYCGKFSTSVAALSGEVPVRDSALLGGEIPVSGNLSPSVAQFPHGKLSYSRDPA